jgi:hypothetical protein
MYYGFKYTVADTMVVFSLDDGCSMFLRNVGIQPKYYIQEDNHLYLHGQENPKSYIAVAELARKYFFLHFIKY